MGKIPDNIPGLYQSCAELQRKNILLLLTIQGINGSVMYIEPVNNDLPFHLGVVVTKLPPLV